jgi:hypothetical protein
MRARKRRGGRAPFEENGMDLGTKDHVELPDSEMRNIATTAQRKF